MDKSLVIHTILKLLQCSFAVMLVLKHVNKVTQRDELSLLQKKIIVFQLFILRKIFQKKVSPFECSSLYIKVFLTFIISYLHKFEIQIFQHNPKVFFLLCSFLIEILCFFSAASCLMQMSQEIKVKKYIKEYNDNDGEKNIKFRTLIMLRFCCRLYKEKKATFNSFFVHLLITILILVNLHNFFCCYKNFINQDFAVMLLFSGQIKLQFK